MSIFAVVASAAVFLSAYALSKPGAQPIAYREWVAVGIPVFLMAGLLGSFFLWLGIRTGWFL